MSRLQILFLRALILLYLIGYAVSVGTSENTESFEINPYFARTVTALIVGSVLITLATSISLGPISITAFVLSKLYVLGNTLPSPAEGFFDLLFCASLIAAEVKFVHHEERMQKEEELEIKRIRKV